MRSAIIKATCEKIVTAAVAAIALSAASTVWAGEPAATLRLATYNIHQGMGKFDKKFKYAIREQLEYLEWEKLDVFGLNEVNWHIERSGMADAPADIAAKELAGELGKCLCETPKIIGESAARGLAALPCGDSPEDGRACRPATAARLYVGATRAAKAARAAVEDWIRDVKSFGVVAVRETMDADNIDKYFEKLRRGDANPTVP